MVFDGKLDRLVAEDGSWETIIDRLVSKKAFTLKVASLRLGAADVPEYMYLAKRFMSSDNLDQWS